MGGKRLTVHPLFFLFGFYYAVTGRITEFFVYTITALLHELGHSYIAERLGYRLNKITLMPFGAVVSSESFNISKKDEIKIAFSGPLFNLIIAVLFIAVWWIYPQSYAITYLVVEANLTLALINFLPFFPLDGGRILLSSLSLKFSNEKAKTICKIISLLGGLFLLSLFIASIFYNINLSLLFFALFILFGVFNRDKENYYSRLKLSLNTCKIKRGIEYKKIAVDTSTTVRNIYKLINNGYIYEIAVFSNNKVVKTISQQKIEEILLVADFDKPISFYL